jgi:hypothetical protein
LIGIYIAVDAALIVYGGWGILKYLVIDAGARKQEQLQNSQSLLNPAVHQANTPQPLALSGAQILANGAKFDLIALVRNQNPKHGASFTYRFVSGSEATQPQKGFILPGEEKYVATLGASFASRPSAVQLELMDVQWRPIDRHAIPDLAAFEKDRLTFTVTNPLFDPAVPVDTKTVGKTTFTLTNATGYGYQAVRVLVVMYTGSAITAVNEATLVALQPGETRNAEVTWFDTLPAISKVEVLPEVDVLDDAVYLRAR